MPMKKSNWNGRPQSSCRLSIPEDMLLPVAMPISTPFSWSLIRASLVIGIMSDPFVTSVPSISAATALTLLIICFTLTYADSSPKWTSA